MLPKRDRAAVGDPEGGNLVIPRWVIVNAPVPCRAATLSRHLERFARAQGEVGALVVAMLINSATGLGRDRTCGNARQSRHDEDDHGAIERFRVRLSSA